MTQEKRRIFHPRSKGPWRDGHVSISIRWIATVVANNLCVFPPDKSILDGRRPRPRRVGLNSSGNGEASASRFSVSIALRQMEMASFHHFRISVSPSALSLSRGSPTHVHRRGRTTKLRNRFIPSKTPRRHWSNPFLNVFLSDRRKSRRFLVGSREIKGEKGRSWEGKVFGNWFSSVGLGDCFGFKEEMYFLGGSFLGNFLENVLRFLMERSSNW